VRARDFVADWGDRLGHLHFTDGSGSFKDEHLFPGEGDQESWALLDDLMAAGWQGQVVLEVNSRKAGNRARRAALLGQTLIEVRTHLGQDIDERTRACVAEALERIATADDLAVLGPDPQGSLGKDWRDG